MSDAPTPTPTWETEDGLTVASLGDAVQQRLVSRAVPVMLASNGRLATGDTIEGFTRSLWHQVGHGGDLGEWTLHQEHQRPDLTVHVSIDIAANQVMIRFPDGSHLAMVLDRTPIPPDDLEAMTGEPSGVHGDTIQMFKRFSYAMLFAGWFIGTISTWGLAHFFAPDLPWWPTLAIIAVGACGWLIAGVALGSPELWSRQVNTMKDNMLVIIFGVMCSLGFFALGLAVA